MPLDVVDVERDGFGGSDGEVVGVEVVFFKDTGGEEDPG